MKEKLIMEGVKSKKVLNYFRILTLNVKKKDMNQKFGVRHKITLNGAPVHQSKMCFNTVLVKMVHFCNQVTVDFSFFPLKTFKFIFLLEVFGCYMTSKMEIDLHDLS